jgi:hypothetical protein
MSSVFQNIDPPSPSPPGECVLPRLWGGGRTHSLDGEGVGGVNILEDARLCYVLYICKWAHLYTEANIIGECSSLPVGESVECHQQQAGQHCRQDALRQHGRQHPLVVKRSVSCDW